MKKYFYMRKITHIFHPTKMPQNGVIELDYLSHNILGYRFKGLGAIITPADVQRMTENETILRVDFPIEFDEYKQTLGLHYTGAVYVYDPKNMPDKTKRKVVGQYDHTVRVFFQETTDV